MIYYITFLIPFWLFYLHNDWFSLHIHFNFNNKLNKLFVWYSIGGIASHNLVGVRSVSHRLGIRHGHGVGGNDWGSGEGTNLPWGMGGQLRMMVVGGDLRIKIIILTCILDGDDAFGYLLAQLEDGQRDGDDEREEGQLQRIEGLQTEHAERQWNQGDGLQQDEHHDWDDDLL